MLSRIAARSTRLILSQRTAGAVAARRGRHADRPGTAAAAAGCSSSARTQQSSILSRRSFSSSATGKTNPAAAHEQTNPSTAATHEQQPHSNRSHSSSETPGGGRSGDSGGSSGSDSETPPPYPPPTLLVRMLSTLALLPIVYLFHDSVASLSSVRGTSMQPTLNPHAVLGRPTIGWNDVVLVWKWGKNRYRYRRGQVVVALSPHNPQIQTCKRLVALEGDWVRHPQEVHVWTAIPRGRVWIEGDNERTSVDDSRQLGPIPMGLLCGRVTHVVWPPSRWGRVETTLEPAGGSARVRTAEQMREHSIPEF